MIPFIIDQMFTGTGKSETVYIPDNCPTCNHRLVTKDLPGGVSSYFLDSCICPRLQYYHNMWQDYKHTVGQATSEVAKSTAYNGLNCSKCSTHYGWAEPNQPDGKTLICWSCRNYPSYR